MRCARHDIRQVWQSCWRSFWSEAVRTCCLPCCCFRAHNLSPRGAPARRELDARAGGELPIVEAFVRRYSPSERPWFPFHPDVHDITLNIELSPDQSYVGGWLLGVYGGEVRRITRAVDQ